MIERLGLDALDYGEIDAVLIRLLIRLLPLRDGTAEEAGGSDENYSLNSVQDFLQAGIVDGESTPRSADFSIRLGRT